MTAIKNEPEDYSGWEEDYSGWKEESSPDEKTLTFGNTEMHYQGNADDSINVHVKTEEERDVVVKKEEGALCQETEEEDTSIQVTVHIKDEDGFSQEEEENKSAVAIRMKDIDLQHYGDTLPSSMEQNGQQVQIKGNQPLSLGEALSLDKRSSYISSCDSFSNTKHLHSHLTSNQSDDFKNGIQRKKSFVLHSGDIFAVNQGKTQSYTSENFGKEFLVTEERNTHNEAFNCHSDGTFHLKQRCETLDKSVIGNDLSKCQLCRKSSKLKCSCEPNELCTGEKILKCEDCGKSFMTRWSLKLHRRTHTGEKPFKCQFCKKMFSRKYVCERHEMTHTGEKPFKCQFCKKTFVEKSKCIQHERTHTGERPFKCVFCEKQFNSKQDCKSHEIVHSGEKPFKCQFCEKVFARKQVRKIHETIHTGERPYKCQHCEKAFAQKTRCRQHERDAHL